MSENTTTPATIQTQKPKKNIVGNLWRKKGISSSGQPYEFLSGSINLENNRIYITINKSKLTPEERAARPTSSDYYITLDDYKPKAKVEAEKVEVEEPF